MFVLLALLVSASAFAPSPTRAAGLTVRHAYAPDGLTPEQWKKQQATEASKKAANKKRNWGVGRTGQEKVRLHFSLPL